MNPKLKAVEGIQNIVGILDPRLFATALVASVLCGFIASFLYTIFYERRGLGSQANRAFPLLALSVTTLFICVQVSLPLSLGLLGALSIIRFRTPIKEPEEVGFIMLVIASSIVCATFNFHFLVILYTLALIILLIVRFGRGFIMSRSDGMALISFEGKHAWQLVKSAEKTVSEHCRNASLESSCGKDGGVSVQFSFSGLKGSPADLQAAIEQLGSVQSVNIFFNRPGSVA